MTVSTAHAMTGLLRRHYLPESRPPAGIFAPEIESPCGRRRADLIWMPVTVAGRGELIGHEVKVTRGDVLAELADPTKADAWMRYCSRWWLTISQPALVDGLDVPDSWGIMAPPSGRRTRSMTVLRPAPLLTPLGGGDGFRRVATWLHHRSADQVGALTHETGRMRRDLEQARHTIDSLRAGGARAQTQEQALVADVLTRWARVTRADGWLARTPDPDDVVAALADLERVRTTTNAAAQRLSALQADLRRILDEPLGYVASQIAKLDASPVPPVTGEATS